MSLTYRDFLSEDEHRLGVLYFGGARTALLDIEAGFWGLRRQLEALVGRRLADAVLQQAGVNGGAFFAQSFFGEGTTDDGPWTTEEGQKALRDCVAAYQAAGFGRFEIEALKWPIGRVLVRAWDTFEAWMVRQHGQETEWPVCAYSAGVLVGFVNVLTGRHDVVCIELACQAQGADACLFELLPAEVAGDVPVVALAPDPALGRQLNLLEILFDRMPMGIVILDRDLRIRRFNPTWAEFVERYSPVSASQVVPGAHFFDLAPDIEDVTMPVFQRVLAGETVYQKAFCLESGGIVSYWDAVLTPLVDDGEVVGIVHVTIDVTERRRMVEALRESEAKFRLLFEKSPDAMLLLDGDVFVDCNQAAVEMMGCSNKEELLSLHPYDISPERQPDGRLSVEKARELIDRAHREGSLRFEWVHRRMDGENFPVEVLLTAIPLHNRQILHVSLRDISDRKRAEEALQEAYRTLEQRVEERTRELSTLLEVSHNIASTLELEPLLGLILDQLRAVVDYTGATVMTLEGENLVILAYRGAIPREEALQWQFPLERAQVNREVIRRREPVIIPNVRGDTPLARAFQETAGGELETTFGYIRSWMGVPLMARERVIGMLTLDHSEPDYYSSRQAKLAMAFADQAALAIENARLFEETRQRLAESQSLQRVTTALLQKLALGEVLEIVCTEAQRLTGAQGSSVFLLEDGEWLQVAFSTGSAAPTFERMPVVGSLTGIAVCEGRPILSNDPANEPRTYRGGEEPTALLAVPLCVEGVAIGALAVVNKPGGFAEEDLRVISLFADQAAMAIENARLYEQARELATVRERQRLARELHDAVTQTLFSASLIAEVLPRLWERDPEEARRRLEELRQLTRGALAEMRTLLLELRPATLTEIPLGDLLRQLAEAITGRARVPVAVEVEGECLLRPDVQVALYRIAQEALNNVAKHAGASQATVSLRCLPDRVILRIADNGCGFDPEIVSPEHLGLSIMRERAEATGAVLTMRSEIGQGTEVVVEWTVDDG